MLRLIGGRIQKSGGTAATRSPRRSTPPRPAATAPENSTLNEKIIKQYTLVNRMVVIRRYLRAGFARFTSGTRVRYD